MMTAGYSSPPIQSAQFRAACRVVEIGLGEDDGRGDLFDFGEGQQLVERHQPGRGIGEAAVTVTSKSRWQPSSSTGPPRSGARA